MSDAFDKKFREKLSEVDIPFDADAWNKMEKKLDALNDDGSARRTFWWWLAPLLLLLLGTGAFFWWRGSSSSTNQQQLPSTTTNNVSIPQQEKETVAPGEKTATLPSKEQQPSTISGGEQKTTTLSTPSPTTAKDSEVSKSAVPPAAQKGAGKIGAPSPLIDRRKPAPAPVLSYPAKEPEVNSNDNIIHLLATLYPKQEKIPAELKSSSKVPLKEPRKAVVEKAKEKKAVPSRKGLSIGVMAGPVFNVAPSLQYGRVGVDAGLSISYHVNNRWSFTTGAIYSAKPYGGTPSDYGVIKKWGQPTPPYYVIRKIDANCGVLDVPLNINYAFMNSAKYTLSATAGLSSYFMLKEKYDYKYQSGWSQDKELTNANQHYLAVLNLAFTYQFPLNKHTSLGIQPFAKIPLRPVGYGEVKLYSTGVMIQLNFNKAKHNR